MRKLITLISFALLFVSLSVSAVKLEGIVMPDTL